MYKRSTQYLIKWIASFMMTESDITQIKAKHKGPEIEQRQRQDFHNIRWLVDGLNVNENSEATYGVKFHRCVNFNFDEEVSIKTTHGTGKFDVTSPLSHDDSTKPSKSILCSNSNTVTSDPTTDSRLKCLELGVESIFKFIEETNAPPPPLQ